MSAWEAARASLTACTQQVQHDHCGGLHRDVEHLRLAGWPTEVHKATRSRLAIRVNS